MFECWSIIILLALLGLEPYLQNPQTKKFKAKNFLSFSADSVKQIWQRPVDRPSRSTCTAVHVCTSADRSGRPGTCQCSLFISVDRAGRPFPPTVGFLTVGGRPTRSTGCCQKVWQTPTALFSDRFLLGSHPNEFLWLLPSLFIPYK